MASDSVVSRHEVIAFVENKVRVSQVSAQFYEPLSTWYQFHQDEASMFRAIAQALQEDEPKKCDGCGQLYEVAMCRRCWEDELLGVSDAALVPRLREEIALYRAFVETVRQPATGVRTIANITEALAVLSDGLAARVREGA